MQKRRCFQAPLVFLKPLLFVAAAQVARVHPNAQAQTLQGLAQVSDEGVVRCGVGDKDVAGGHGTFSLLVMLTANDQTAIPESNYRSDYITPLSPTQLSVGDRHELGTRLWATSRGQVTLRPVQRETIGTWLMS
jgi:hypothetical protein